MLADQEKEGSTIQMFDGSQLSWHNPPSQFSLLSRCYSFHCKKRDALKTLSCTRRICITALSLCGRQSLGLCSRLFLVPHPRHLCRGGQEHLLQAVVGLPQPPVCPQPCAPSWCLQSSVAQHRAGSALVLIVNQPVLRVRARGHGRELPARHTT